MPGSGITKRALAAALKERMQTTPFAKISVGDICASCNMNRKSFYYHFRDKYELVNWIFYTEFVEAVQRSDVQEGDSWSLIALVCGHFYDNRSFYVNALEVAGQDSFSEYFAEVVRPVIQGFVQEKLDDREDNGFFAVFFVDAFLVSVKRWLSEGEMDAATYTALLRRVLEGLREGA